MLREGMVLSDEPGYYKEGEFGIRIEDLLMIVDVGSDYLGFQTLTIVPYDRNLIQTSLLSREEIDYINLYHKRVYETLSPILIKNLDQIAL